MYKPILVMCDVDDTVRRRYSLGRRQTWIRMAHSTLCAAPSLLRCRVWYRVEWLQKFDICVCSTRREQERSQREPVSLLTSMMD